MTIVKSPEIVYVRSLIFIGSGFVGIISSDVNNRSTAKVFSGLLISLSTSVDRKGQCVISEKSGFRLPWNRRIKNMQPTKVQNEALNRDYDIFVSDPESTAPWLDDKLVDSLIALTGKLREKSNIKSGIRYGYINNNFLIVIPTAKKFFDPGSFRKINDPDRARSMYEGICVLYDIIDTIT